MTSCVISQKRAKENRITMELHLLIPEGHAHINKEESLECLRSLEISQYPVILLRHGKMRGALYGNDARDRNAKTMRNVE